MGNGIWPTILLIGKNGQIGWELERSMAPFGRVVALDYPQIDLSKPDSIIQTLRAIKPNLIVNAAAYTAVDQAEIEPDLAMDINGIAPGIFAEEAKKLGAFLVHYSTDYVFDGSKTTPYMEEDEPNPLNMYGKSKLEGDKAIQAAEIPYLIFRTSWVYGLRGKNFLLTILRLAEENKEIPVVCDQIGTPTWSRMIADCTCLILAQGNRAVVEKPGLYNLSAYGQTTWYEFAESIIAISPGINKKTTKLVQITSADYAYPTSRPKYSVLSNRKIYDHFGISVPAWDIVLKMAIGY